MTLKKKIDINDGNHTILHKGEIVRIPKKQKKPLSKLMCFLIGVACGILGANVVV
jgi:hypothetical protein